MIRNVEIRNFKSITELTFELGRVTVLIGSNGSGKSNILEAVAFAAAASQRKLDNEFLTTRGIRVTDTRFMQAAFETSQTERTTSIFASLEDGILRGCTLEPQLESTVAKWKLSIRPDRRQITDSEPWLKKLPENIQEFVNLMMGSDGTLPQFLIFSPENTALRNFETEGQILPLGIHGEGLFAHLKALSAPRFVHHIDEITEVVSLIDWFDSFEIPSNLSAGERRLAIRDRFLPAGSAFDQRSANEGFLFLLFYSTLLISPDTPKFFAIDNVETALNPKLCVEAIRQIVRLTAKHDRQVILTTHNPAILDGLDLTDDSQRLMVVERTSDGHTRTRRVPPPRSVEGQAPIALSQAFMRGFLGGLPNNF